eukprot:747394-Hanusia_phi.AAC.8
MVSREMMQGLQLPLALEKLQGLQHPGASSVSLSKLEDRPRDACESLQDSDSLTRRLPPAVEALDSQRDLPPPHRPATLDRLSPAVGDPALPPAERSPWTESLPATQAHGLTRYPLLPRALRAKDALAVLDARLRWMSPYSPTNWMKGEQGALTCV